MTSKIHNFPQKFSLKGNVFNVDASWRELEVRKRKKDWKTKKNSNLLEFNELFSSHETRNRKNHILFASLFEVVSTLWMNENTQNFIADTSLSYTFTNHLFIYHSSFTKIAFISNIHIPNALLPTTTTIIIVIIIIRVVAIMHHIHHHPQNRQNRSFMPS